MARLRVRYARGEAVKYLSHLDVLRAWERAIRRAELPLAYSAGFTPHPKISFAAPLAVGVTSEVELMDLTFAEPIGPAEFRSRIEPQLPGGFTVVDVHEIPDRGKSLPALVEVIDYQVVVGTTEPVAEIERRIAGLLAAESLPRDRTREKTTKSYDLRPLLVDLAYGGPVDGGHCLRMALVAGNLGAGRPEEVTAALGIPDRPRRIHRVGIRLRQESSAE